MDLGSAVSAVEAALADGDASVTVTLGGQREEVRARLWRGEVLVDWEPDATAGGCLLRPQLLRRLGALHAAVQVDGNTVTVLASGRIVAALSPEHAQLVAKLGGAARVEVRLRLHFAAESYRGGDETYSLVERGERVPLLKLTARVWRRTSLATR